MGAWIAGMRGKGQGSIYVRKSDGLYCSALSLPALNGKRRRKVVTVNPHFPKELTDRQARAAVTVKLNKLKDQLERHGDLPTAGQTTEQWLNVWYESIASKKNRPKTLRTYRTLLEQYIIPTIGKVRLDALTPAHVRRVEAYIIGKGLSSSTAMQAHRVIAVALKYAEREGRVTKNAATLTDAPRRAVPNLSILTPTEAITVIRHTRADRLGSRWAAALFTGARQGELLGLEINRVTDELDLSWQLQRLSWEHGCKTPCGHPRGSECPDRTVTTPADFEARYLAGGMWLTRPKSRAGWRIIPLVDPLRTAINERIEAAAHEPNPFGLVWTADPKRVPGRDTLRPLDGSPIDPSHDNRAWHRTLRSAEVTDVRLHDARHTTASLLLAAGVRPEVIQAILGHSSYVTSQGYMNVDRSQLVGGMTGIAGQLTAAPTSGGVTPEVGPKS